MIAIDTNVVLRYILQDQPAQARRANNLFATHDQILISDVVLAETVWVLTGAKYRVSRADVITLIQALMQEACVRFEDSQRVWSALNLFRRARRHQGKQADFADVLILLSTRAYIESRDHAFEGWYTFDQGAQLLAGARAL